MAAKHRVCERKRRHLSDVEPPTLLQAASDLCDIFGIETRGIKSDNGLCVDYLKYCKKIGWCWLATKVENECRLMCFIMN